MKTQLFAAVAVVASLSAETAVASQRCGYFGISTKNPCTPQQQQAPAPLPEEEAFVADPYQAPAPAPAPAPCHQQQQAPAPAPSYRKTQSYNTYSYNGGYNYNNGYSRRAYRRQEAQTSNSSLELGARLIQDSANFEVGAGLYLRAHQRTGSQRFAVELSADATESSLLTQGAVMAYLNPLGVVKPFGLLGGGLEVQTGSTTAQAGVGLDLDLFPRFTLTGDVRVVESVSGCFDCGKPSEFLLGNVGISRKF